MGVQSVLKDNKKILLLSFGLLVVCVVVVFGLDSGIYSPLNSLVSEKETYTQAEDVLEEGIDYNMLVKTIYGDIQIDLYEDTAPKAVNSLLFLAGKGYYSDLTFHKVIKDFVIQAGDTKGDGTGHPGYTIPLENATSFLEYSVGMGNASQFFIVLPNADTSSFNGEYTVVGRVTKGYDVVDSISKVTVDDNYKPVNAVKIVNVQVLED